MITGFVIRRAALSGLAAAVLALSGGAVAAAPAVAEDSCKALTCPADDTTTSPPGEGEPGPGPVVPSPPPSEQPAPAPVRPPAAPAPAPAPARPPAAPAPAPAPVRPPAPPVPAPEPAPATEAALPAPEPMVEETVTPSPTVSALTRSPEPSTESNWNTPIRKPTQPSHEAALVSFDGPGPGLGGLAAIIGGVFLVGVAGLAFAWWARSRFSSH